MPDKIFHRDSQIEKIKQTFEHFKQFGQFSADNLIILGVTGSGKTVTVTKIIGQENNCMFLSGKDTKTSFKTIKKLTDGKSNAFDIVLADAINNLKENPKIIIIDELNYIKDVNNLFNDLNTIYRATGVPIILITNNRVLLSQMPEDAIKTLFFKRVEFPSYNANELYDILKDRLDKYNIPENALRYICAIGSKDGSARIIMRLTKECIKSNDYSENFIRQKKIEMEQDWVLNWLSSINDTEEKCLRAMLKLKEDSIEITPSEIRNTLDIDPPRISELITKFEEYGFITTKYINKGRGGGRTRVISFVSEAYYKKLVQLVNEKDSQEILKPGDTW